jgi:hypothetical protein
LVLDQPTIRQYRQIAWIDSDILFNPLGAPAIFADVPDDKVGAVDSFADPSTEENRIALQRMWALLRASSGFPAIGEYARPEDVYRNYGAPIEPLDRMFNAGVLVASPLHHRGLFRHVYDTYVDRGTPSYYENIPLSYELVSRKLVHWLDPRFNHLWAWSKLLHYPFLQDWRPRTTRDKILRRLALWMGNEYEQRVAKACATSALINCHCLHFAGFADEISLVDLDAAVADRVGNLGIR